MPFPALGKQDDGPLVAKPQTIAGQYDKVEISAISW